MTRLPGLLCLALAFAPLAVAAQDDHAGHGDADATSPAAEAFAAANARMHAAMDIPPSGNPDVDFIRGMIAHHQGAVDMSRILLDHGSDPEVRAFAEAVIAAQEEEIGWMQDWLAANAP
jgi:uncharacterized protein (DUF305 family)